MNRTSMPLAIAVLVIALAAAADAAVTVKQVPVMRFVSDVTIHAPASAIWPHLTQGKNLATWCPEFKAPVNQGKSLARVGDVMEFKDEFGNGGSSIVTYIVPGRELRIAHEPTDGSYMCQAKLTLKPSGKSTVVTYQEQYTDESSDKDREATSKKMQDATSREMLALKAAVEKRSTR